MLVGYARVSTDGQTLDAQLASLKAAGAEKVFAEKVSGAVTDRKALAKAIAALGPNDVLLVTGSTALPAQPETSLMSWTACLKLALSSNPLRIVGQTRPRHMGS
jgi:hypothetical protein